MPPDVTCPVCRRRLPAECGPVCPRCGAALPRTEVWPAGDIPTTQPAPLATAVCRACGKTAPELCLLCPHCEEPLAERHRVRRPGVGEEDFGPGLPARLWMLMSFVGFMGVLFCFLLAFEATISGGRAGRSGAIAFVVIYSLVFAAFVFPFVVGRQSRAGRAWWAFVGHALAGFGCLITVGLATAVFLIVGVICAVLLR